MPVVYTQGTQRFFCIYVPHTQGLHRSHRPLKNKHLIDINELSERVSLSVKQLRKLTSKRIISCVRIGHRTLRYNPQIVTKELESFFGVQSVTQRRKVSL